MIALFNSSSADFPQLHHHTVLGCLSCSQPVLNLKTSSRDMGGPTPMYETYFLHGLCSVWRSFVKRCRVLPPKVLRCKFSRYSSLLTDLHLQSVILVEHRKLWFVSRVCEFSRFQEVEVQNIHSAEWGISSCLRCECLEPRERRQLGDLCNTSYLCFLASVQSCCLRPGHALAFPCPAQHCSARHSHQC